MKNAKRFLAMLLAVLMVMTSVVTAVALGVIGVGIAMLGLIKILAAASTFVPVVSVT